MAESRPNYAEAANALQQGLNHYRHFGNALAAIQALGAVEADKQVMEKERDAVKAELEAARKEYAQKTAELDVLYQQHREAAFRDGAKLDHEIQAKVLALHEREEQMARTRQDHADALAHAQREHTQFLARAKAEREAIEQEIVERRKALETEKAAVQQQRDAARKALERFAQPA